MKYILMEFTDTIQTGLNSLIGRKNCLPFRICARDPCVVATLFTINVNKTWSNYI